MRENAYLLLFDAYMPPLKKFCLLLFLCIVASIVGRRKDVIGTNQLSIKAKYKCLQLFNKKAPMFFLGHGENRVSYQTTFLMPRASFAKQSLYLFFVRCFSSPSPRRIHPRCCLFSSHYFHTRTATATSSHTSRLS